MQVSRTALIVLFSGLVGAGLAAQRGGGTRVAAGPGMPAGHDRNASRQLPGAVNGAAEHRRLPAEEHAGDRRAQGAEGKVSCDRRSQPPGIAQPGVDEAARRHDGSAQPASADARRQHQRRTPGADRRGDQRLALQGSFPRAGRHQLQQRRSGLGRQGDSTAARRHQGRRAGRRRGRQAVWLADHQARWLAIEGRRSRDRSVVG